MGNCQAVDAAALVIQHPSGKVDKLYWPVTASEVMKSNPGHYVALLITTTLYRHNTSSTKTNTTNTAKNSKNNDNNNNSKTTNKISSSSSSSAQNNDDNSVRVTRVKLLRPTDTLALGHVYRLISTHEVMKGIVAKKQAKLRKNGVEFPDKEEAIKDIEKAVRRYQLDKNLLHQVNTPHENRHRSSSSSSSSSRGTAASGSGSTNGGTSKPKTWQPSLQSISEGAS